MHGCLSFFRSLIMLRLYSEHPFAHSRPHVPYPCLHTRSPTLMLLVCAAPCCYPPFLHPLVNPVKSQQTLQASSDLKTSACCTAKAPPADVLAVLRQLPQEIIQKYYGCGSPFPAGLKGSWLRVLDLGCGTGRDCYVCAALVGEGGFVTGARRAGWDVQSSVLETMSLLSGFGSGSSSSCHMASSSSSSRDSYSSSAAATAVLVWGVPVRFWG
jgi:hypothetical protein